nr:diphthamide biosynthesis enzyme Dph2 [Candidatus Methanofastidiosa archaeon]
MLTLELDGLLDEVGKHDAGTLGVQLPSGLRQRAREIAGFFKSHGYEVIFSGDPSYGACDVSDDVLASAGADLLLHFGHSRMVGPSRIPVIYWHVRDDIDIAAVISGNIEKIRSMGKRVGLATTIQHVHKLGGVKSLLEDAGLSVMLGEPIDRVSFPGQVLGCSFETMDALDVDFFIYIGTGTFHPIGMSLSTDREVLRCDPYTGTCENVTAERDKILKKRYAMINKARDKKDFAVLISTKK